MQKIKYNNEIEMQVNIVVLMEKVNEIIDHIGRKDMVKEPIAKNNVVKKEVTDADIDKLMENIK